MSAPPCGKGVLLQGTANNYSHVFYISDVQAVSDNYELPVEQKQPQYEAVVEPDAIYEEPPQVPELTTSELDNNKK